MKPKLKSALTSLHLFLTKNVELTIEERFCLDEFVLATLNKSAESSRNEKTYCLTREELESFGEHCNNYDSGIFDIDQEECYEDNIVDEWLKNNNK